MTTDSRYFGGIWTRVFHGALAAAVLCAGALVFTMPAGAQEADDDDREWVEEMDEPYRLAVAGKYDEAIALFEKLREESPEDITSLDALRFAVAYAAKGDREGHLAHSRWLLAQYPSPELASDADRSIKGYIVVPWASDPQLLAEGVKRMRFATDKAVEVGELGYMPWFYASRGIAEYRTGQYEAASEWLSQAAGEEDPYIRGLALNFYAMAEHAQGNEEAARVLLEEAREVVSALPERGTEDYEANWSDTLVARMTLEEAEEKIAAAPAE